MNMVIRKPLEEILAESPEIRKELEDFAHFLWEKQRQGEMSGKAARFDFDRLEGLGLKEPLNPNPQFKSEKDLWK